MQEAGFTGSDGQRVRAIPQPLDTHADTHVAAALDPIGGLLDVRQFPATPAGYTGLLDWLAGFGTVCLVGIEGTGSYGAGLTRHITSAGIRVVEGAESGLSWPMARGCTPTPAGH